MTGAARISDGLDSHDGLTLLSRFVEECLNRVDLGEIGEIFSPMYRDYDPIPMPWGGSVNHPSGNVRDIYNMVTFLADPRVDALFQLEDAFQSNDRVGYRLFGHGIVTMSDSGSAQADQSADHLFNTGAPVRPTAATMDVQYRSVGIFRIASGRFIERWGAVVFE